MSSATDYVDRVAAGEPVATDRRELSPQVRVEEALFTGLRLTAGLDLARIRARYGLDTWARYGEALQPFVEAGLLIYDADHLALTKRGTLLANEVLAVFIGAPVR